MSDDRDQDREPDVWDEILARDRMNEGGGYIHFNWASFRGAE